MNQVFEKIYEDYIRSNKTVREKTWKKYGFTNEIDFLIFLGRGTDPASRPSSGREIKAGPKIPTPKATRKKVEIAVAPEEPPTDMIIAFDTTGSMRSYIGAVRKHVEETIQNLFTNVPKLKLKLVAFGDYCDMPRTMASYGKAYQETEMTDDKNVLIKFVQDAEDTGGGDGPEFYELVLHKILEETPLRRNSNRSILLIADDNPHEVGYTLKPWVTNSQLDWKKEAQKAASMGIKIDTLRIHSHIRWYEELSRMTNGTCMDFKSADKTQNIVEAATYFNSGSKMSMRAMSAKFRSAVADGDTELVGAYKGMAADRGIDLDKL